MPQTRKNSTLKVLAIIFSSLIIFSCTTTPKKASLNTMRGFVSDAQGRTVANAHLVLNGKNATESDSSGKFVFTDITYGENTIDITGERIEPRKIVFNFLKEEEIISIRVTTADNILSGIEKAASESNWAEIELLISEYEKSNFNEPIIRWWQAILLLREKSPENATKVRDILQQLKADGYSPNGYEEMMRIVREILPQGEKGIDTTALP
jgi:hypothetical protein